MKSRRHAGRPVSRALLPVLASCACVVSCSTTPVTPTARSCTGTEAEFVARHLTAARTVVREGDLSLTPGPGDSLRVVDDAFRLSGLCLDRVSGHMWPLVRLDDNSFLVWKEEAGFEPLPGRQPDSGFMGIGPRDDVRSSWGMGEYLGAAFVDASRSASGVHSHYLGVWGGPERSLVASFLRAQDGSFSKPHVLISVETPARSVSYFPSPDTPSGRISLTVEVDGGLLLYALSWSHPQAFR